MTVMNVLVTGGAGYIGSCVCKTLLDAGHSVVAVDSCKYGSGRMVPDGCRLHIRNIEEDTFGDVLEAYEIDSIAHLAAESWIPLSMKVPELFYRVNVCGMTRLLELAVRYGVKAFVWSSTSSVYAPTSGCHKEDDPVDPISPYGSSKLAAEGLAKWFSQIHGLRTITFRFFNVCGATPHCWEEPYHRERIIPQVVMAARRGTPFCLHGTDYDTPDGTCIRDYIHVQDVANAHLRAFDGNASGTYNLGIGRGYSNREVIEATERVTGKRVNVLANDRRPGDPPILTCDASKANAELNWFPKYVDLDSIVSTVDAHMIRHSQ